MLLKNPGTFKGFSSQKILLLENTKRQKQNLQVGSFKFQTSLSILKYRDYKSDFATIWKTKFIQKHIEKIG